MPTIAPAALASIAQQSRRALTAGFAMAGLALLLGVAEAPAQAPTPNAPIEVVTENFETGQADSTWIVVNDDGTVSPAAPPDVSDPAPATPSTPSTTPAPGDPQHASAASTTAAEHDLLVVLIDAIGDGSLPFSRIEASERIFDDSRWINGFMLDQSFGKTRFEGDLTDVHGWVNAPDLSNEPNGCKAQIWYLWVQDLLVANNISIDGYEHLLFLVNCDFAPGGASTLGPGVYDYAPGSCTCSSSYLMQRPDGWNDVYGTIHDNVEANGTVLLPWFEAVAVHELGHALGGTHDSLHTCGARVWDLPARCDSGDWSSGNYGNYFSALGRPVHAWSFSAGTRHQIGWLDPARLLMVDEPGVWDIGPINGAAAGEPVAAAITDPATGEIAYFVELRVPIGFDADLHLAEPGNNVMISTRRARPGLNNVRPQVLDGVPDQPGIDFDANVYVDDDGFYDWDKVGFAEGAGFTDEFGISIIIESIDLTTPRVTFSVHHGNTGDINCDGIVNIADAGAIARYILNGSADGGPCTGVPHPPTLINAAAADSNLNGVINVADAAALAQCVLEVDNPWCPPRS